MSGWRDFLSSRLGQWLSLAAVALTGLIAIGLADSYIRRQVVDDRDHALTLALNHAIHHLESDLHNYLAAAESLAAIVPFSTDDPVAITPFDRLAARLLERHPELLGFAYFDADGISHYVYQRPPLPTDLTAPFALPDVWLPPRRPEPRAEFSAPRRVPPDGLLIAGYAPVMPGGTYQGLVQGICDLSAMIRTAMQQLGPGVGLRLSANGSVFYDGLPHHPPTISGPVVVGANAWQVQMGWMQPRLPTPPPLYLLLIWLGGGLPVLMVLIGLERSFAHSRQLAATVAAQTQALQHSIATQRQVEEGLWIKDYAITSAISAFALADLRGRLTYVNAAFLRLWGYTAAAEVVGCYGIAFWQDQDTARVAFQAVLTEGKWHGELSGRRRDGSTFAAEVFGSLVRDANGRPLCTLGCYIDISERKRAEQALVQSETRFRRLFEEVPSIPVQGYDQERRIIFWNQASTQLYGYTADEALGRRLEETIIPPELWETCFADHDRWLREGQPIPPSELLLQRKDGSRVAVFSSHVMLINTRGEPELFCVDLDLTGIKQAEQALRESEERLRTVIANVPVVLYTLDSRGVFTLSEGRGLEVLGLQPGEVVGHSVFDWYAAYPEVLNAVRQALAGQTVSAVVEVDDLVFDNRSNPLLDLQGQVVGVIGVATNITEHIRAEQARERSDALVRAITEQMLDGVSLVDSAGNYVFVNQRLCELVGYREAELLRMNIRDLLPPGQQPRLLPLALQNRAIIGETELCRQDGTRLAIEVNANLIHLHDQPLVLGIVRDISERRAAQARLRQLSSAVEQTADSIVISDRDGFIEYVNPAFEQTTGYTLAEVVGRKTSLLKSGLHPPGFYQALWHTLLAGDSFRAVFTNRRKDGSLFAEEQTITPLKDADGHITHFVSTGKDITERIQIQDRLHYLAYHDVLTGLPNRSLFIERLEQALARGPHRSRQLSVLFLDFDHFKIINDSLGHTAGDQALRGVAERLQACVRPGDTVARLGGDEFTILLVDLAAPDDVTHVVQKIQHALHQPLTIAERECFITVSIGISLYPSDGEDVQTLLRNADAAMYRAKEQGRNTHQFYAQELSNRAFQRLTLETSLRRGLERDEFLLYYQPQVDASSGAIVGLEALIRWRHPELGMVPPAQFIPIAEETGLIAVLDTWSLRTACQQIGTWRAAGLLDCRIAVNLSGRTFDQPGLAEAIAAILRDNGLPADCLELEITESTLMHGAERTVELLASLSGMRLRLAVDDFGTGYSSLTYLKRFPLDTLKVDQSFVRGVPADADDVAIVSAIIGLARNLGLSVLAEGVETAEQMAFLRAQGCQQMQGYLFSRPLPASEITRLLQEGTGLLPVVSS